MRPSDSGARTSTKLMKVNVPMKANRIQKPMAKADRSDGLRQWAIMAASGDWVAGIACIGWTRAMVKYTSTAPARLSAAKK